MFSAGTTFNAAITSTAANAWSGTNNFTGAVATSVATPNASLGLFAGSAPALSLISSTAPVNARLWFTAVDGLGNYIIETFDDAASVSKVAFQAGRTASAVTSVILGNTTDKPPITLNGKVTIPVPPGATVTLDVTGANAVAGAVFRGSSGQWGGFILEDNAAGHDWIVAAGNVAGAAASGSYVLYDATVGAGRFAIDIAGKMSGFGPIAAALVDMTPDKGSFAPTYTGFSSAPPGNITWVKMGNIAILTLPNATGTSNGTTYSFSNLPASITPSTNSAVVLLPAFQDNSTILSTVAACQILTTGTMRFAPSAVNPAGINYSAWTSSGTKGAQASLIITYSLV